MQFAFGQFIDFGEPLLEWTTRWRRLLSFRFEKELEIPSSSSSLLLLFFFGIIRCWKASWLDHGHGLDISRIVAWTNPQPSLTWRYIIYLFIDVVFSLELSATALVWKTTSDNGTWLRSQVFFFVFSLSFRSFPIGCYVQHSRRERENHRLPNEKFHIFPSFFSLLFEEKTKFFLSSFSFVDPRSITAHLSCASYFRKVKRLSRIIWKWGVQTLSVTRVLLGGSTLALVEVFSQFKFFFMFRCVCGMVGLGVR